MDNVGYALANGFAFETYGRWNALNDIALDSGITWNVSGNGATASQAVEHNGEIFFVRSSATQSWVMKYNPVTQTFTELLDITSTIYLRNGNYSGMTISGDNIYMHFDNAVTTKFARYNITDNTITGTLSQPSLTYYNKLHSYDGTIYNVGTTTTSAGSAVMRAYNIATNTWSLKATPPWTGGTQGGTFAIDDKIYFFEGTDLYEYDISTNTYSKKLDLPLSCFLSAGATIGENGYICNIGVGAGATGRLLRYDQLNNKIEEKATNTVKRWGSLFISVGTQLYVICGKDETNAVKKTIHKFNIKSQKLDALMSWLASR